MKNKEEEIRKYLKQKSALIVTESNTDRTAWKKLFIELGINLNKFYSATDLAEAKDIIESKGPSIVFSSYMINGKLVNELVELHIENFPDRSDYFFYVVSEKNSLAVAAAAAESEIDGLLIKPYNQQELKNLVEGSLEDAINLSKEIKHFNQVMASIRQKDFESAEEGADKYIVNKPNSPNGYFLRGLNKKSSGAIEEAVGIWNIALSKDKLHHKTLCNLFDTYIELKDFNESYELAKVLTEEYPINPNRIPNFIRSSLATKNYHNLIKFCDTILDVNDDLETIKRPISAALAISGKNLLLNPTQESRDLIIDTAKKALELTELDSKIAITSFQNLLELEKYEIVKSYIDEIPSDDLGIELLTIELKVCESTEGNDKAFIKAQNLIKVNKISPDIYRVLLRTGKEIGKSKDQLEDMVFDGAKHYPELKEEFLAIID